MKNIILLIGFMALYTLGSAQNNSINYKAVIKDNLGNVVANQSISVQFSILQGIAQTNVYQETHTPTTDDNGIIILNIGEGYVNSGAYATIDWVSDEHFLNVQIDTGSGITDMGTTKFLSVPYAINALTASNVTGLEALDEGNGTGWRLRGKDPINFGNIGWRSVDLSQEIDSNPSQLGALGFGSFASGIATTATGYISTTLGVGTKADASYSTALGSLNIGGGDPVNWVLTDPLLELGNANPNGTSRTNALTILKNGTITAPSFDMAEITDDKALITKEYADTNLGGSGLEALNEGNGTGWRLKNQNPANYDKIGGNAVDFSISTSASTTYGASGFNSFAVGKNTTASGSYSTAMGYSSTATGNQSFAAGDITEATGIRSTAFGFVTKASGLVATAMGDHTEASGISSTAMNSYTDASGNYATAMGERTNADASHSLVLGRFNLGGGTATSWVETDPLFEIGNGSSTGNRSNALTVLKNGTITAPSFDMAKITDDKALITKEYADTNLGGSGLEALNEGNGTGWRLKGKDPANYGDIGLSAVDFSTTPSASTTHGATGAYSTALGSYTKASGDYATAMGFHTEASGKYATVMGGSTDAESYMSMTLGRYNVGGGTGSSWVATDPLFEIGNGNGASNRSNALTVLKNGTITAPSFDMAEITDDKALITKEYAEVNLGGSGLETLDEGNGIGWRLKGKDPANYGDIGSNAVDLSINGIPNTSKGARGNRSFASGTGTEASGNYSTAMGISTKASGLTSTAMGSSTEATGTYTIAMGNNTIASGYTSTAMGEDTKAQSYATMALGRFNEGGGSANTWEDTDPLFEIGNGFNNSYRSNALTVLKNGKVGIGNHQPNGFLEVQAANSGGQPNINLIHEGATGARINFSNTDTTNGNVWSFYGDTNDNEASSTFNLFHTNTGNIIQVKGDGDVGINGTPDTEFHLHHGNNGLASGMKLENSSDNSWWRFYVSSGSDDLRLYSKSQGTTIIGTFDDISGAYTSSSDRRLKKNFKDLYFNWEDFMKLETLTYQYKVQDNNQSHIGLIAQDVAPMYPELVNYNADEDVYQLNYSGFGVIAIKAVQELKDEVESLKEENLNLKAQISKFEALEARLTALENSSTFNETSISAAKK